MNRFTINEPSNMFWQQCHLNCIIIPSRSIPLISSFHLDTSRYIPRYIPEHLVNFPASNNVDHSNALYDTPDVFSDYVFHTGPLRADPSPLMEWPSRISDSQANPNLNKKYQSDLKDYKILYESNRRARKYNQHAFSLLCMAILYDNCKKWKKVMF